MDRSKLNGACSVRRRKKIVNYDKYVTKNKLKFLSKFYDLWVKYTSRVGRMRPRSSIESRILIKLDEIRKRKMIQSGGLKMLGPRLWKLKVFET
jgi:hypothetical protein